MGRLTQANDSNDHKLNFSYDALNRLIQENQSGSLVGYTYDDNGNLDSITSPESKETRYVYDELDRLTNIKQGTESIASYSYTGMLNNEINLGNGKNISNTFDDLNRLQSLNNGVKTYNYTYDDVSNITSDAFKNYTYDQIYRLTQVNETNSGILLESFNYDSVGNRTSDGNTTSYTTNNLNQYTTLSGSTLTGALVYDNNGNIASDGEKSYFYDYKNRLLKVVNGTGSGIIVEYTYDVLGRRYEKKTPSERIKYVYSNENVLTEYKTQGGVTLKKQYINGLGTDEIIAVEQEENSMTRAEKQELQFCQERVLGYSESFEEYGWSEIVGRCESLEGSGSNVVTARYYFHKNHLGSVVGITDNSGSLVTEYEYDAYGNFTRSGSDIGNTRLYTGREYDAEIELYYLRARYYSSELGRFISRDPIDIADDVNLYAYVGNSPMMGVDLMGLACQKKALVIGFNGLSLSNISGEVTDRTDKFYSTIGWAMEEVNDSLYDDKSIAVQNKLYNTNIIGSRINGLKEDIKNSDYDKLIILGHSFGADSAVEFSNELKAEGVTVDLLITIDMFAFEETTVLENNILEAENYYQTNGVNEGRDRFGLITGANELTRALGNTTTKIHNYKANTRCSIYNCQILDVSKFEYDHDKAYYHQTLDDGLVKDKIIQNSIRNRLLN